MTGWIVTGILSVAAVLGVFANHRYHWAAGWRYSWQHAAHVLELTETGAVPAPEYGSMIWDEERGLHGPGASTTLLPAPPPELAHEPDWREQTAADLAPEALGWPDSQVTTDGSAPGWLGAGPFSCHPWPDSGPGAGLSSLTAPGPDSGTAMVAGEIPARPFDGVHETAVPPTRLADTGDIASAHMLADVQAYMRAQDDDAKAYGSAGELGWHDFMQQYWAGFAGARA